MAQTMNFDSSKNRGEKKLRKSIDAYGEIVIVSVVAALAAQTKTKTKEIIL